MEATERFEALAGLPDEAVPLDEIALLVAYAVVAALLGLLPLVAVVAGALPPLLLADPPGDAHGLLRLLWWLPLSTVLGLVVLTGLDTKGLEFDAIVVVRPEEIEAESATGRSTLYVVLTRATQLLTTVS